VSAVVERGPTPRPTFLWIEALAARGGLVLVGSGLFVFLTLPLATMLVRSLEDRAGAFVGFANFVQYFASPAFGRSAWNTIAFAGLTTAITVPSKRN